jgi:hypothetical protein
MQTIQIQVDDSNFDSVLNILTNLKDGLIEKLEVKNVDSNLQYDLFFYERKKHLHVLRENIKNGKESMYDFDESMDELLEELGA